MPADAVVNDGHASHQVVVMPQHQARSMGVMPGHHPQA
jgi:hypothetical protein